MVAVPATAAPEPRFEPTVRRVTPAADVGLDSLTEIAYDSAEGTFVVSDRAGSRVVIDPDGTPVRPGSGRPTRPQVDDGVQLTGTYDSMTDQAFTYDPASRSFVGSGGDVISLRDLGLTGSARDAVVAPTADPTDDSTATSLYVVDGDSMTEIALAAVETVAAPLMTVATLVTTIDLWQLDPPSPDSAGVTYLPDAGHLLVSDSEVNEMPIFADVNLFELSLSAADPGGGPFALVGAGDTTPWSAEPTGVGYDPVSGHLFSSNDDADEVYEVVDGGDGQFGTADDTVTSFDTRVFGGTDVEGVGVDTLRNRLLVVDGVGMEVWRIEPGPNGAFDGADDVVTSFDVQVVGAQDPEGVAYNHLDDTVLVLDHKSTAVFELTPDGTLLRTIDISSVFMRQAAGVTLAPASDGSGDWHLYVVERGVDNNSDPNENDGKLHEFAVPFGPVEDVAPVAGDDTAVTAADTPVVIDVVANDTDANGNLDPSSVTVTTAPSAGTADAAAGDGTITYTPAPGTSGTDTFQYQVCDLTGLCDSAVVTVEVVPPTPPDAVDDAASTQVGDAVVVDVLLNDVAGTAPIDAASVSIPTAPANGSAVAAADGTITYTPSPGFVGDDSFVYEVCDTDGLCDTATVSVAVLAGTPTTVQSRVAASSDDAEENASGNSSLTSSDLELVFDKDLQTVGIRFPNVDVPAGAVITAAHVQFTTDEISTGPVALTVHGQLSPDPLGFTGAFGEISSRPTTAASVSWSPPDWTTTGAAGPGERTSDLSTVVQELVDQPGWAAGQAMAVIVTGTGERVAESFDGVSASAPLLVVSYLVDTAPSAPQAVDDAVTTATDVPVVVNVLANDSDVDGDLDPTSVSVVTPPSSGGAVANSDGTVTYTPAPGFAGGDSFTYEVCDLGGLCAIATVTVTVEAPVPPTAVDDAASTPADTPVVVDVLANDVPGPAALDPASVSVVTPPSSGTAAPDLDGTITYTPAAGTSGTDSFTYEVCDAASLCDTAAVTVTVVPPTPVVAVDDAASTQVDTATTVDVLANDVAGSTPVDVGSVSIVGPPTSGTATANADGSVTYAPSPGFVGDDSFVYEVCDLAGLCDTATVTVAVLAGDPVTVEVRVADASDDAEENAAGRVSLTSSDLELVFDKDLQTVGIRFLGVDVPPGAVVTAAHVQFTTDERSTGESSLTIRGQLSPDPSTFVNSSGDISSRPATSASASWSPPDWTTTGAAGPGERTSDLSAVVQEIIDQPGWAAGQAMAVIITGTGERVAESFNGDSAAAPLLSVSYLLDTGPSAPVVVDDTATTATEVPVIIDVLGNDSDADGDLDPSSLTIITAPSSGTAQVRADSRVTYSPNAGFAGADSFVYEVCDLGGLCGSATVSVSVEAPVPPTAVDDTASTAVDTPVVVDVLANDVPGPAALDPASVTVVTPPSSGTAAPDLDGTITYTPAAGTSGTDSFTYEVCDAASLCDTAAVTVTVVPPTPVVAVDDAASTQADTAVTIDVLANDVAGSAAIDPSSVTVASGPSSGSTAVGTDGSITYTPSVGFSGDDSFTYEVCDLNGLCDTATVTVSVLAGQPITLQVRVTDAADDAEENTSGRVSLTSSDLELVFDKDDQVVGVRFVGVDVPRNAVVTEAFLQFTVDENTGGASSLVVEGQLSPDTLSFDNTTGNISSRPRTTTSVAWSPPDWNGTGSAGPAQRTPNLASVVQEIISQPGWTAGQSMVMILTGSGERVAESYNGDAAAAPLLEVSYLLDGSPPTPLPPIAADDDASALTGEVLVIDVVANDFDPDGDLDPTSVSVVVDPTQGTTIAVGDGTVTYEANPGYTGADTFQYQVCDLGGLCDTATVTVTVSDPSGNTAPVVDAGPDQTVTLADDALLLGTWADDGITMDPTLVDVAWSVVSGPGTVDVAHDDEALTTASFSAAGTYTLRLTADDGLATASDDVVVTVNATHANTLRVPQDFATIQAALDAAGDDDLVLVDRGTYVETLYIGNGVTLASTYYTTGDPTAVTETVIQSPDVLLETVTFGSSTPPDAQIVGFTVTAGKDGAKVRGTASVIDNRFVSLDTDAVDFSTDGRGLVRGNLMQFNGDDGVDIDTADVIIEDNTMLDNTGDGIEIRTVDQASDVLHITIRGNRITNNDSDAIQLIDDDLVLPQPTAALLRIDRNLLADNAQAGIGMMDLGDTTEDYRAASLLERVLVTHNTIVGNDHGISGGDRTVVLNNIFSGNATVGVKGVDGDSIVSSNLFWANGLDADTSNVDTVRTVTADPLLAADRTLLAGSPAIDAGTTDYTLSSGELILVTEPDEYLGAAPDLGAFEAG